MYLPDINVWLALSFQAHGHHKAAVRWFDMREDESCKFCRQTQSGYLRLSTNPALFKNETQTLSNAWSCYDKLMGDPRVGYIQEPLGLEHVWREFTMRREFSHKVWNDAYLAAFAIVGGFRLSTFDGGFKEYGDLDVEILA